MTHRWMILIAVGLSLALAGCSGESAKQAAQRKLDEAAVAAKQKAAEVAQETIDKAVESAKTNVTKSAEELYRQAMEFGAETPEHLLNASKEAMTQVKAGIEKAAEPDSPQRKWATNLWRQIARIDAALLAKRLEKEAGEMLEQARSAGKVASDNAEKARQELRSSNPEFKELDDRRIAAIKQLEDMTEQLKVTAPMFPQ